MIPRLFQRCLVRPEELAPSRDDLEVVGAFNPGVAEAGAEVVLMVRVAERPKERRPGQVGLPRWKPREGLVVDWIPDDAITYLDPRVVEFKATGRVRLTFISHLRVMRSPDGRSLDSLSAEHFSPQTIYEEFGVEDPRITRIGEHYYITYVAVSRHGAATALATTRDFQSFERHGIILYPENKDVVLFPERIDGDYMALHRPNAATPFTVPEIWLAHSPDLLHWGRHEVLELDSSDWSAGRVGAGAPPVRVPGGWLEIYHGNDRRSETDGVGAYAAGVLLLDPADPAKVLRRGAEPILVPEADFERNGFVPNVVFPTGLVERGGAVLLYYGAADSAVGVVELSLEDIMGVLNGGTAGAKVGNSRY